MLSKKSRLLGAILLVSGTTIGAGMLALPVTTGLAGFFPAVVLMTGIWLFMMLTAFYFLEVNVRVKGENNLISMMKATLGKPGEIISWIIYLLLLYALTSAYLLGCSQILSHFFESTMASSLPEWVWPLIIFCFFACFVYFGTIVTDFLNRFMMLGLFLAYFSMLFIGSSHVNASLFSHINWGYALPSISVVITTFGYHIIIPTLSTYLEHDSKLVKRAIIIGSLIPFVIYLFWQLLVMGIVPVSGDLSLEEATRQGKQVTFFLKTLINSHVFSAAVQSFAFFAIVTSLLGVSLSLTDFLADGLKIKKTYWGKFFLVLLAFLPPLIFAIFYPKGFILALKYAGVFVVILLALFPSLMAWCERYCPPASRAFQPSAFKVPGGKLLLGSTILISLVLLGIEVFA
jgi:tyrosine-specific transport protein